MDPMTDEKRSGGRKSGGTTAGRDTAGRNPAGAGPSPGTSEPAATGRPADEGLSYEQARAELATVVERLEAGGTSLEESLALWERGETLAAVCQRWLEGARARIESARQPADS
jgi:exodeoxyribonuclease VII small subunit